MRLSRYAAAWRAWGASALLAVGAAVAAEVPPGEASAVPPLTLEALLDGTRDSFPQILSALQKAQAQAGKLLASEGAFDARLEQSTKNRLSGYYDGRYLDSKVVKPLPELGTRLYGGYRIADGLFPVYEDEFATLSGGEVKVGAIFSLWRDRDIDERRGGLYDSRLALQQAEREATLTRVRVQHQAARAYVDWLAAGDALSVYRDLLALAETRQSGLQTRVSEGDLASVYLNENLQYILKRRGKVAEGERKLAESANKLSLFLRTDRGLPRQPQPDERPAQWPDLGSVDPDSIEPTINAALAVRPEVGLIATDIERERNRLALGQNALKPRVDLNLEAARDFGAGSRTRDGTDAIVKLDVTIPIEQRSARGRIAESEANLNRLTLDQQLLNERIAIEIRNIANELLAARRFVDLAAQEVEQADLLAAAERDKFEDGASDFFVVNLREEAAADARVRQIEARLGYLAALTDYYAATVRVDRFRLGAL